MRALLRFGVGIGLIASSLVALLVVLVFPHVPRLPLLGLLAVGPLFAIWIARRARPRDADVVLFVDRKLAADEAIVTAWELARADEGVPATVQAAATAALAKATASDVRPRVT